MAWVNRIVVNRGRAINVKETIRRIAPSGLIALYRHVRAPGIRFRGEFDSWDAAARHSSGYQVPEIFERVRSAARRVRDGTAVAERDGVLLDKVPYPFPVISVLLHAAMEGGGRLTVLDFGGALGSSFFHCREFLTHVRPLRWHVVEQPEFVACGQREFEDSQLRFFSSVESACAAGQAQVVLVSGVLQYLPAPARQLELLAGIGAKYIVIDRTPIAFDGRQLCTVQIVPSALGKASYPAWLFNEHELTKPLQENFEERAQFDAVDGVLGYGSLRAQFKGFVFAAK